MPKELSKLTLPVNRNVRYLGYGLALPLIGTMGYAAYKNPIFQLFKSKPAELEKPDKNSELANAFGQFHPI